MQGNLSAIHLPAFLCNSFYPSPVFWIFYSKFSVPSEACPPPTNDGVSSLGSYFIPRAAALSNSCQFDLFQCAAASANSEIHRLYVPCLPGTFVFIFYNPEAT